MKPDEQMALVRAWQQGNQDAGRQLCEYYFHRIRRFFLNKVAAGEEQDLVQATFLACQESLPRFRGEASFRTYLFRIARNVRTDHYQKKSKHPQPLDLDEVSVAALQPSPSSMVGRNRQHRLLLQALRQISMHSQEVLELKYWEHMSASEIGEVLDLEEPAVKSRIRRAKEAVRKELAKLARNPQELASTVDNLERWAQEVRAQMEEQSEPEGAPQPEQ